MADPADGTAVASPLIVRTGRGTVVGTDAMLAAGERLDRVAEHLESVRRRLLGVGAQVDEVATVARPSGAPPGLGSQMTSREVTADIDDAAGQLTTCVDRARELRSDLRSAMDGYADTESRLQGAARGAGSLIAHQAGLLGRILGPALLAPAAMLAATLLAAWRVAPGTDAEKAAALGAVLREHPELITNPAFAHTVRRLVSETDELAVGSIGLPAVWAEALGERGLGILGVETSAGAVLLGAGLFAAGRETAVAVERRSVSRGIVPAAGVRERLDRVPEVDQVRIERYDSPGRPSRYAVFVGPTETFSPFATDEPWDMTSNIGAVAGAAAPGAEAGSLRAVELAMRDAGISSTDEVQLVGFSQGGLVAARVAESADWNVVGLETHGAPVGGIPLDESISGLEVHHSEDFVAALGGDVEPDGRVHIERRAFPGEIPTEKVAPAHQRASYEETAAAIDLAQSEVVREQGRAMDAFARDYVESEGGSATELIYRAARTDALVDRTVSPERMWAPGPGLTSVAR